MKELIFPFVIDGFSGERTGNHRGYSYLIPFYQLPLPLPQAELPLEDGEKQAKEFLMQKNFFEESDSSTIQTPETPTKKGRRSRKTKLFVDKVSVYLVDLVQQYTVKDGETVIFSPPRPREPKATPKELLYPEFPRLLAQFRDAEKKRKTLQKWGVKTIHTRTNVSPSVTAIFYGPPGTGKSMLIEALAYACEADILEVKASDIFHRWVGETPKNIQRLFDYYQDLFNVYNLFGQKVFLVINEADQLLSVRRPVVHTWDQESNSVQDLLLQQLESFRGYFLVTTNLVDNIDFAFWRRFLVKQEIALPDREARKQLWYFYFPRSEYLDPSVNVDELVSFELSPGQIANIVEVACLRAIGENRKLSQMDLLYFIQKELLLTARKTKNIGF
ncbi:MAG: ATP-binding protein [Brevinematales bacterium]|nr:ATP-binding protein [Brevinematales bacterium]